MTRYIVLLTQPDHFRRWEAATDEERRATFETFDAFDRALTERGAEIVGGEGLEAPETARTLGPGTPSERVVTDGPYAESVEQIGGFFVVEASGIEDVVECARVLMRDCTVEVRPATPRDA